MQNVIIMRHGLAENNHVDGDFSRCLTASGKIGVKKIAKQVNQFCSDNALVLSRIKHSPFKRTKETASIVHDCFIEEGFPSSDPSSSIGQEVEVEAQVEVEVEVETEENLVPSAQVSSLLNSWQEASDSEVSILVSHQPFVSQLISELVNGDVSHAGQYPMYPSDAVFLCGDFFSTGLMTLQAKFSIISQ